jgi:hypothetical protein
VAFINPGPYGVVGLSNIHPQGSGKFSGVASIAKPYYLRERNDLLPPVTNREDL